MLISIRRIDACVAAIAMKIILHASFSTNTAFVTMINVSSIIIEKMADVAIILCKSNNGAFSIHAFRTRALYSFTSHAQYLIHRKAVHCMTAVDLFIVTKSARYEHIATSRVQLANPQVVTTPKGPVISTCVRSIVLN